MAVERVWPRYHRARLTRSGDLPIQSQMAAIFLGRLRALGKDPGPLAAHCGVEVSGRRELSIGVRALREWGDGAAELSGDPFFGLHAAQSLEKGAYGLVEFVCRSAQTVRDGLEQLLRYQRLVNEVVEYSLVERGSVIALEHRIPGEPLAAGRQGNEFTVALFVQLARLLTGAPCPARRVWFVHPPPADVNELAEHFGTTHFDFNASANGVETDASLLELKIQSADSALHSVLAEQAQQELSRKPQSFDFLGRVREHVRVSLEKGAPGIERVAAAMKMSARTLQRRLADDGTSFQDVVEDVRQTLARVYLADPKLAVGEVAFLLGYSDPRAFVRAFKRWTGKTPGESRG